MGTVSMHRQHIVMSDSHLHARQNVWLAVAKQLSSQVDNSLSEF